MENKDSGIPKTKIYDKLILKISLEVVSMGKPSMNPKFKREISTIINKYYPNWKTIEYEFK